MERLFGQVQFVSERSRRYQSFIKLRLLRSSLVRIMQSARAAESHRLDATKRQCNRNLSRRWQLYGNSFPSSEVVFLIQVIVIYEVIALCLVNFSLGCRD